MPTASSASASKVYCVVWGSRPRYWLRSERLDDQWYSTVTFLCACPRAKPHIRLK